jgi:hypothetical protein
MYCNIPGITKQLPGKLPPKIEAIGEVFDIYCVAKKRKPIASLDFSTYGRNKLKKNKDQVNRVIHFCNEKGVQMLHNKQRGGMYLKSIFFLPHNYKRALQLMYILWSDDFQGYYYTVATGLLLGYSLPDIRAYHRKNHDGLEISSQEFKHIQGILRTMDIKFEDLPKKYQYEHKLSIPLL